jgi:hypothetical protein
MVQNFSKILLQVRSRGFDWTKDTKWHPSLDEVSYMKMVRNGGYSSFAPPLYQALNSNSF